jgi:hypothetical protein
MGLNCDPFKNYFYILKIDLKHIYIGIKVNELKDSFVLRTLYILCCMRILNKCKSSGLCDVFSENKELSVREVHT